MYNLFNIGKQKDLFGGNIIMAMLWERKGNTTAYVPMSQSRYDSNFSAKTIPTISHNAHQNAAHPLQHIPMGLPDDVAKFLGGHLGLVGSAGVDVLLRSGQK